MEWDGSSMDAATEALAASDAAVHHSKTSPNRELACNDRSKDQIHGIGTPDRRWGDPGSMRSGHDRSMYPGSMI